MRRLRIACQIVDTTKRTPRIVCAAIQACFEKDAMGSIWCRWLAKPVIGSPRPAAVAVKMTNPRKLNNFIPVLFISPITPPQEFEVRKLKFPTCYSHAKRAGEAFRATLRERRVREPGHVSWRPCLQH